jgi:hypothetical protein
MKQQGDKGHQTELEALDHQARGGGENREAKKAEVKPKQTPADRAKTLSANGGKGKDEDGFLSKEEFLQPVTQTLSY